MKLKNFVAIILVIVVLLACTLIVWANNPLRSDEINRAIIVNDKDSILVYDELSGVRIENRLFTTNVGLIYYPGARVEATAYINRLAPLVQKNLAKVYITKPFLGFAVFGISDAEILIKNHPEINSWFIAGHSLGGAMACEYFSKNQEKFSGLILFGSYCAADIRETAKKVVSLSGTLDAFSTTEKIEKYREKLPTSARFVFVEGANHSQMGNYGLQPGDNEPFAKETEVSFVITEELEKLLKN